MRYPCPFLRYQPLRPGYFTWQAAQEDVGRVLQHCPTPTPKSRASGVCLVVIMVMSNAVVSPMNSYEILWISMFHFVIVSWYEINKGHFWTQAGSGRLPCAVSAQGPAAGSTGRAASLFNGWGWKQGPVSTPWGDDFFGYDLKHRFFVFEHVWSEHQAWSCIFLWLGRGIIWTYLSLITYHWLVIYIILNLIELKVNIISTWASKPLSKPQGTVPSNCHTIRILTCLGHTQSHSSIHSNVQSHGCIPISCGNLGRNREQSWAIAISSIFCQLKLVSVLPPLRFCHGTSSCPRTGVDDEGMVEAFGPMSLAKLGTGWDRDARMTWHTWHTWRLHDDYMTWHRVPVGS